VSVDEFRHAAYFGQDSDGATIAWPAPLAARVSAWAVYQRHEYLNQALHHLFRQFLDLLPALEDEQANTWTACAGQLRAALDDRPRWVVDYLPSATAATSVEEFARLLRKHLGEDLGRPRCTTPANEARISARLSEARSAGQRVWAALGMLGCLFARRGAWGAPYGDVPATEVSRFRLGLEHLVRDLDGMRSVTLAEAAVRLVESHVLRRHLRVAMHKLCAEGINTFKFYQEDGRLRFRATLDFRDTAPRVGSAIQILGDLGLLRPVKGGRYSLTGEGRGRLLAQLEGVTA
jgi:hypothetical protein